MNRFARYLLALALNAWAMLTDPVPSHVATAFNPRTGEDTGLLWLYGCPTDATASGRADALLPARLDFDIERVTASDQVPNSPDSPYRSELAHIERLARLRGLPTVAWIASELAELP